MLSRCFIQYVNKSGRPSSGHRTRKGQSSSQFPRKVVLKNVQIIGQLHSSLVRSCSKSWMLGFSLMRTKNFQMSKLGLEKEEEPEIKLPTHAGSQRKLGKSRKTSTCFMDYAKAFDCVDHSKMWEAFKEMGIPGHLTCLLRNLNAGQEAIARTLYGTIDWFKIQKGVQHSCLLSPCLFNLYASTSWEMPGWVSNKLETRRWEKPHQLQICGWNHSNSSKRRRLQEPLDGDEGGEWRS